MARVEIRIPSKPYPEYPLFAAKNGQWRKDIWSSRLRRAEQFYFGSWEDDPRGERALAEYMNARDAIANGTYRAKIATQQGGYSIRQLAKEYLAARYQDMQAGKLTGSAYNLMLLEIERFRVWVDANLGESVIVEGMRVEFFTSYVHNMLTVRKLGPFAEKRVKSLIKTMFRWGADIRGVLQGFR